MKRSFRTWFLTVTIILILFVVVFFTYAWFTSNRAVSTNTVTARTDEENLNCSSAAQEAAVFGIHSRHPLRRSIRLMQSI